MATITVTLERTSTRVALDSLLVDCPAAMTTLASMLPAIRLAGALHAGPGGPVAETVPAGEKKP
jgi:hypothetical protein